FAAPPAVPPPALRGNRLGIAHRRAGSGAAVHIPALTHREKREPMTQRNRILIAVGVIALIALVAVGAQFLLSPSSSGSDAPGTTATAGGIPIKVGDGVVGSFKPDDLGKLTEVSFVDSEENKEQSGWLVQDVLLLYVDNAALTPDTSITISSS